MRRNSRATIGLLRNLHRSASVGQVCKLAMLLGKWTLASSSRKQFTCEHPVMRGALQAIVLLWSSVYDKLKSATFAEAQSNMSSTFSYETFLTPLLLWAKSSSAASHDDDDEV
jgi:hypothetical protein